MKKMDDVICQHCGLDFQVYWIVATGDVDFCPGCGEQIVYEPIVIPAETSRVPYG
jgi:hypothetical protein